MQKHQLVSGMLPKDGDAIIQALDAASKDGFTVTHTAITAWDEDSAYYVATLAMPMGNPDARPSIPMGERHVMGRAAVVNPNPPKQ